MEGKKPVVKYNGKKKIKKFVERISERRRKKKKTKK